MKLLKRIAIMASSGIGLVGVILMLLEVFGVECFSALNTLAFADGKVRAAGLIFALLIVIALAALNAQVFLIAFRGEKAYKASLVTLKGDKDDVVLIQRETLDSLVKKVIGEPEGIQEIKVDTEYHDMKLDVKMDVALEIDANIRETTDKIREDVRNQLENVNGLPVNSVSILISKINVSAISDGMSMPWAGKTEENTEITEEVKEEPAEEANAVEPEETFEAAETAEEAGQELFEPAELSDDIGEDKE